MSERLDNIAYIVAFRTGNQQREHALQFTLRRVREYFPSIEILVVEQDEQPRLSLDKSLRADQVFIRNAGAFNKSWAFNCAVRHTVKEVLVFADADIFLEREGYLECFRAIKEFDAVTPNKRDISNVSLDMNATNPIQFLHTRKLYTFAGGILIMTRTAFDQIGGWDERFEGWGGEDDAMSHVIYNRLKSKSFYLPNYHIDHPHENVAGHNHPKYRWNQNLALEISTRNGHALDRYIEQLQSFDLGNPEKYNPQVAKPEQARQKFVLAITTYNRLDYLRSCVESFLQTRSHAFDWQLIIADDGSKDGTKEYLTQIEKKHKAIIIHNDRTHIHHQVNTILQRLSTMSFDLCFKCDDDVAFLQKGWDELYWDTIDRTGYAHLIFYDKHWQPYANRSQVLKFGKLVSNCSAEQIQGAFYTITPEMIDRVGYFDTQQFGASGLGHVDFSFRSCRAGFNVLAHPFDVENSNDYLQLQAVHSYTSAISLKQKIEQNDSEILDRKRQLLRMGRLYIPYNENLTKKSPEGRNAETKRAKRRKTKKYKKADATFYPDRGIGGFVGFFLKRIYNLAIDLRLYFVPAGLKFMGKALNKISIHLINIEQ